MTQELQRRQMQCASQHKPVNEDHQRHRHGRSHPEGIGVPAGHIGGQAVAAVVHVGAEIFQKSIAQQISHRSTDKRNQNRHCHVVAHKLAPCIAGGAQRTDNRSLLANRVCSRDGKHKRHDRYDNVEKYDHHGTVAAHILPRKGDSLILIGWYKILQGHSFVDHLHEILSGILFSGFIVRRCVIGPGVVPDLGFF